MAFISETIFTTFAFIVVVIPFSRCQSTVGVTQSQFNKAVTDNGGPSPSSEQYSAFLSSIPKADITTKLEAAMYLAQLIHESAGLRAKREIPCTGASGGARCPSRYADPNNRFNRPCGNINGRSYYGRGYIQLTWCDNYKRASRALGLGTALVTDPDSVASNENRAWDVSAWYWKTRVHRLLGSSGQFGKTTKGINPGECSGSGSAARVRFTKYRKVFSAFQLSGTPNERGCYN